MFKIISFIIASTFFSMNASASSTVADGYLQYKMPSGEIVQRSVSLEVPSRGQGEVVLIGNQEIVAKRFWSERSEGRTIFNIMFDQFPGANDGDLAVFKGTYVRGSNLASYYGDIFKYKKGSTNKDIRKTEGTYIAGFWFQADIK